MNYEASFTYFFASEENKSENGKSAILSQIKALDIEVKDDYEEDGSWNVDCIMRVDADNPQDADRKIIETANKVRGYWDYHYIKGIDNGYYWEP